MPHLRPILLAEDNPNDAELVLSALHGMKISNQIVVVGDGEQALDYLYSRGAYAGSKRPTPAVVLLDLKMPRVDGREVLRQLREDPALSMTPVVVFTSSKEEIDVLQSYRLGANAFVVKPVDFQDFIIAVTKLGSFWATLNEPPPSIVPT
ncbi:MAG TPA: response regulator [Opitutus sp.]|nr:response regulator [Opitutus sp.]